MEELTQKINELVETLNSNSVPLWLTVFCMIVPIVISLAVAIFAVVQHYQNKRLQKAISDKELRVQMHGDNTLDILCEQTNSMRGWMLHNDYKNTMGKLIHVHGTVDQSMVLGVHDESQISDIESFKSHDPYYLAQLIKSQTDLINEENTYKQALQILNSSSLIYIYGMSLGETDKLWWKNICQLLTQNGEVRVIIHCHDMPKNELLRMDIKRFEDRQRYKLFELGDVSEEQRSSFQSRVHVTGGNIFNELKDFVVPKQEQAKAS